MHLLITALGFKALVPNLDNKLASISVVIHTNDPMHRKEVIAKKKVSIKYKKKEPNPLEHPRRKGAAP